MLRPRNGVAGAVRRQRDGTTLKQKNATGSKTLDGFSNDSAGSLPRPSPVKSAIHMESPNKLFVKKR